MTNFYRDLKISFTHPAKKILTNTILCLISWLCFHQPIHAQTSSVYKQMTISNEQWINYRQHFVLPEGRVVDDANADISHTESQGFGLLLAAFADDQISFAKIWTWTQLNLYVRKDNLGAWRWDPNSSKHVTDTNNATDGDILVAWALAEAGQRWRVPEYRSIARKIVLAIFQNATSDSAYGKILLPAVSGFGAKDRQDGPIINLSYWVFPAFDSLKTLAPDVDWTGLNNAGFTLLNQASFGPLKLPSDWISLKYGVSPASGFATTFGYDAIRIPLYLAAGQKVNMPLLKRFTDVWNNKNNKPFLVEVTSGAISQEFQDEGYRAVVALANCVVSHQKFPTELLDLRYEHYYSTTLQILSIMFARERYPQCF